MTKRTLSNPALSSSVDPPTGACAKIRRVMSNLSSLKQEIKAFIVRRLRLTDVAPESIGDTDPLIGGGLDLDSVDLLDLVVGVEKEYGIRIANVAEGKEILASVNALAECIARRRPSA